MGPPSVAGLTFKQEQFVQARGVRTFVAKRKRMKKVFSIKRCRMAIGIGTNILLMKINYAGNITKRSGILVRFTAGRKETRLFSKEYGIFCGAKPASYSVSTGRFPGAKWPESEAERLLLSRSEARTNGTMPSLPPYAFTPYTQVTSNIQAGKETYFLLLTEQLKIIKIKYSHINSFV